MIEDEEPRWRRVRKIVEEVLRYRTADRIKLARRCCAGDAELEQSVLALLRCDDSDDDFLEPPDRAGWRDTLALQTTMIGRVVGRYRLIEPLGVGGMGMVYRGERIDGLFDHPVAVKLIRGDIDSDHARERFENERFSLGRLEHPSITRLLDGGTTPDGAPYVVMEYVEGLPIDEYCRHADLSLDQRLTLFLAVCDAVQFAHRNLVVHRDLKPSNILVNDRGEPKLLDFGLCKILAAGAPGERREQDLTAAPILTLRYSSPEQIRCEPITTSTDIYSLGCILYELLTDMQPYGAAERSSYDLVQAICNVEPTRPSVALRSQNNGVMNVASTKASGSRSGPGRGVTGTSRRRLDVDLDNIVLKAMQKNPAKRYASVERLTDDLQRYRTGHTVRARDATFIYRATKFLRRNRLGAAVLLLFLLAIGGGLAGTIIGLRNARRAQRQAEAEATRASAIGEFLKDTLASVDPNTAPGGGLTALELLDGAAERLSEFAPGDLVEASLRLTLGTAYLRFGKFDQSQAHLSRAVELSRSHGDRKLIAESLRELGLARFQSGEYEAAERALREAVAIRREDGGGSRTELALAMSALGGTLYAAGEATEAEALLHEAVTLLRAEPAEDETALGDALNSLAAVYRGQGRLPKAESTFEEALSIVERARGKRNLDVAIILSNLGNLKRTQGRFAEAESLLQRALDIQRSLLQPDHPDLATALNNLALVWMHMGKFDLAEPLLRESLAIVQKVRGRKHPHTAVAMSNLASLLLETGAYADSAALFKESLAIQMEILPPDHPTVRRTQEQYEKLLALQNGQERKADHRDGQADDEHVDSDRKRAEEH